MGCHRFWNYQHLLATTKNGILINTGKFPLSFGSYATIPKALHRKLIDWHQSIYLDVAHVNFAFGDCISVGGFKFALIFVDRVM